MLKLINKDNKRFHRLLIISFLLILLPFQNFTTLIESAQAAVLLSDNFVGTTIDTAKWQEIDAGGSGGTTGYIQQNDSLTTNGDGSWGNARLVSQNAFNRSDVLTLQADFSVDTSGVFAAPIVFGANTALNAATADNYWIVIHNTGNFYIARGDQGTWTTLTSTGVSVVLNRRYRGKINIGESTGATFELYQDTNGDGDFNDAGEDTDLFAGVTNSIAAGSLASGYFITTTYSPAATTTIYNAQVTSSITIPDAPTNLLASPATGQMSLSWTAPASNGGSSITDYVVEYKLASEPTIWTTFADGTSTNTTATVTGLTNGQSYDFRVSATNSIGTSVVSSTATATPNLSVAGAPQDLNVLIGGNSAVDLSWTAPASNGGSSITDYVVEYKLASEPTIWTTFADGTSTNTTATVTGLTNGQSYDFRVSATNSIGTSVVSSTATATPNIYALSDIFTGTTINTDKWTETDSGGLGGTVGNVQQNNALTITGNNAWGTNGLTSVNTFDRSNGDVEITVTMQATSCTSGNSFEFGYGDMVITPNGTSYIITKNSSAWTFYSWENGSTAGSVAISGVTCLDNTDLTMKLVVLQGGGAEVYLGESATPAATTSWGTMTNQPVWMQGNSAGVTTTFQSIYVTEPVTGPFAPSNLSAIVGDAEVNLSWTAPDNNGSAITDYIIEYKLSLASTWTTFADGTSTNITATVTGLSNGFNYNFRVSAVNANGTSSVSSTATARPISSTATAPTASSVAITGSVSIGELITGTYTFNDVNGDSEATSLYRWLRADTVGGTYSAVSGETSINYTITSSDLNKYLKFEVIPIADTTPITGNAVLSTASSQVNQVSYFNHILSTGQSLSTGQNGAPALSISQPYSNKMLSGSSLVPLVESGVETMSSAMANTLTTLSSSGDFQSAVTRHGIGGTKYSGLKKGTSAYSNGLSQATNVKNAATALGMTDRVIGVTTIHGESDHISGNGAVYESYLVEWQSDYNTDVKAITGQTSDIPLFTDQMSSHTNYSAATSLIPIAQLAAAENNPGDIVLVTPKYFFTYSDGAHLTNTSYRWLGEYYGKVMKKVVLDNEAWRPLSPDTIVRNANIIYAQFHVPEGELAFDTTLVSARSNYGFEYYDSTTSTSISSVELLDSETVKVTLGGIPTGSDQKLRYAYTGVIGSAPGAQNAGSVAGNLRDTDATSSLYGNALYNWSVHFDKSIIEDSTLPINSSITSTPASISAAITWTTDELGSSMVDYGLTSSYSTSTTEVNTPTRVTSHSVALSSLVACTTYHYRVRSKDLAQNQGTSSDSTFITTGCTGSAVVEETEVGTVATSTGATIGLNSGTANISLDIPSDFSSTTSSNVEFQLNQLNGDTVILATGNPDGRNVVGDHIYELAAYEDVDTIIDNFDEDLTITITYTDSEVSGLDETTLAIYYWTGSAWSVLDNCSVNTTANTVSCTTNHFTTFGVFGSEASSNGPGGYIFSPPSIGSGQSDIHIGMNETRNDFVLDSKNINLLMYINSRFNFNLNNTAYKLKVIDLDTFNSKAEIKLNDYTFSLSPNEAKIFDLNNDGIDDLKLVFNILTANRLDLTLTSLKSNNFSLGTLVKEFGSPAVYWLVDGVKRAILNAQVFLAHNFKWSDIKEFVSLDQYTNGEVLDYPQTELSNGSIVKEKNSPRVYLIENNKKRYIFDAITFNNLKLSWGDIKEVDDLSMYVLGEVLVEKINTATLFYKSLSIGMTNNSDIERLQELLATQSDIYPEAIVSGYFGPLTERAVQRFQLKYNVVSSSDDVGFGYVGPKTRAKLAEVF